jgi:diadenosine tetraphosphate (Ap4A) HIT family hydrolase
VSLDQLWAGWRHDYVTAAGAAERQGTEDGCVFCRLAASGPPSAENGVVWRGDLVFAVLNAYPYASGHLMVLPLRHVGSLGDLTDQEGAELWSATRRGVAALEAAFGPEGINLGANLGQAAGAGIPRHLHFHAVPRWLGDTNFMTAVAGTRVLPQTLAVTWERLRAAWPD